jgi:hypothetical protein
MKAAFEEAAQARAGEDASGQDAKALAHDEGDPANAVEPDSVE